MGSSEHERREVTPRRVKDEILAWATPVLITMCGIFLLKLMGTIESNTSTVNAQAVTLAQMQVMLNNNTLIMGNMSVSVDRVREQQINLSERLVKIESGQRILQNR